MKRYFYYAILFLLFSASSFAQSQFCFTNPSIEGVSQPHVVPAPWIACYGSPDTQPGQWGITQLPSNGNTYVSFLQSGWAPTAYTEGMSQQVTPALIAGQSYTFTLDLAHTNIYQTADPNGCYSSLVIYGGLSQCATTEILWQSGAFYTTAWTTYTVTFTPSQNWTYISMSPYYITTCGSTGFDYINCMVDNISCINPSGVAGGINPTCFGLCNGTGNANPLGGTPPYTYLWTPGNQTTQSITGLCAGSYTLVVTDANNLTFSDTLNLTAPAPLVASPQTINSSCNPTCNGITSVNLTGGTPTYTYLWTPGNQTTQTVSNLCPGNYTVVGTDINGCTVSHAYTVTGPPPLTLSTSAPVTICSGQSTTLTATGGGGTPNYNYLWLPGSGTGSSVVVSPTTTTNYTVIVTDANNCSTQVVTTVAISPYISLNAGNNVTICPNNSTPLNATATTSNGVTYSWYPSSGLSCINCSNPVASPSATTTYYCVGTNGTCTYTDSVTVFVSTVQAAFIPNPPTGAMPLNVVFNNTSVNGVTYLWNFGDGSPTDNTTNPTHTYSNNGSYTVMLITTNSNGCVDTTYFTIIVEQPYTLTVPNVFTPNGDGMNENFTPTFSGVTEFTCTIYNRWGDEVYSWNTLTGYWDGTIKGSAASDGTYYYVMFLHAADGTDHVEKGFLTLLRNK